MSVTAVEHVCVNLKNYLQTNTKQEYCILSDQYLKDNKMVSGFSQALLFALSVPGSKVCKDGLMMVK